MSEVAAASLPHPSSSEKIIRTIAVGIMVALLPVAPRYARHVLNRYNLRTLRTAENTAVFDANRRFSDIDAIKVKDVIEALGRQVAEDDWEGVSATIARFDTSREALAYSPVRLTDVVFDALRRDMAEVIYPPTVCNPSHYYLIPDEMLARLEAASRARPGDPWLTALLAQTHIDRGWCARGGGWSNEVTEEGWEELMNSFATAEALLTRFDPEELRSPFYARARFQLLATADADHGLDAAREAYHDWSDLDTRNPAPHRSFAFFALPRWFGSWPQFEAEARLAAKRTRHSMGKSAYAIFYLQAFAYDEGEALESLDPHFFAEALDDLVSHDANPVGRAVEAALRLGRIVEPEAVTLIGEVFDLAANRKRDALRPLIRRMFDHHVAYLPTREGSNAEAELLDLIAEAYQPEIRAGQQVAFTPEGLRMVDPS